MTIQRIAVILMIVGLICLLWAMNMDTTYEGFYNLHLGNQQTSWLIFGGFLFLGGVVLFALFKLKQSPKQEREEEVAREALREKAGQQLTSAAESTSGVIQGMKRWWLGDPASDSDNQRSGTAMKLLAGIPLSFIVGHAMSNLIISLRMAVAGDFADQLETMNSAYDNFFPVLIVVAIGALMYTLRSRRLAQAAMQLSSIAGVAVLIDFFTSYGLGPNGEVLAIAIGAVFLISIFMLRRSGSSN